VLVRGKVVSLARLGVGVEKKVDAARLLNIMLDLKTNNGWAA